MPGFTESQRHALAAADAAGRVYVTSIDGRTVIVLKPAPSTVAEIDSVEEQAAKVAALLTSHGIETDPRPMLMIPCSEVAADYLHQAFESCEFDSEFHEWALAQLIVNAAEELGDDPVKMLGKYKSG